MKNILLTIAILFYAMSISYSQTPSCFTPSNEPPHCSVCDTLRTMSTDPLHPDQCVSSNRVNNFDWYGDGNSLNGGQVWNINKFLYPQSTIQSPFYNRINTNQLNYLWDESTPNAHIFCLPKDGWELVKKDFGYYWDASGNTDVANLKPINYGNKQIAYLVLYNKYTSVLRVIGTISNIVGNGFIGGNIQVTVSFKPKDSSIPWSTTALFNHYSVDEFNKTVSQSIDMPTSATSIMSSAAWSAQTGEWFFADFMMAYDPCTCNNPSALSFQFQGVANESITLNGKFYGVAQPIPNLGSANGDNGNGNPVVNWLSSASVENTQGGNTVGLAGMQTYALGTDVSEDYENAMTKYENDLNMKESNQEMIDDFKDFESIISAIVLVAARTEGDTDPKSPSGADLNEAITGVFEKGFDFYSSGLSTPTEPVQPWIVQGELTLSGSVQLKNSLPQVNFEVINPGSQYSDCVNSDGTSFFPEFTSACTIPTGQSYCTESPSYPGYNYYNLPMGNFAVLSKPTVRHRTFNTVLYEPNLYTDVDSYINEYRDLDEEFQFNAIGDIYDFDESSFKYVYNPAVPVDVENSTILTSLVVDINYNMSPPETYPLKIAMCDDRMAWGIAPCLFEGLDNHPTFGFNPELIPLETSTLTHYEISTPSVPVEELGSMICSYTRPWQLTNVRSCMGGNSPTDFSADIANAGVIQGVYLKVSAVIAYKPDPLYPGITPRKRTLIAMYPVNVIEDDNLPIIDPTYEACRNNVIVIPTTEYNKESYITGIITIDGNQTVDNGNNAYFLSCSDLIVRNESKLTGEFVLTPSYDPNNGIQSNTNPNKGLSYMSDIVGNATTPSKCVNTQYYKANTTASSRIFESVATPLKNPFNPKENIDYLVVSPNPAHSSVKLACQVERQSEAKLYIIDMLGNVVKNVFDFIPQEHSLREENVDISGLASGIYFCIFDIEGHKEIEKLIVTN